MNNLESGQLRPLSPFQIEFNQYWKDILLTMDAEHRRIVETAALEMAERIEDGGRPEIRNNLHNAVYFITAEAAIAKTRERTPPPLTMPASIAVIYLDDNCAVPFNHCANCTYLLPGRLAIPDDGIRMRYFDHCPICDTPT